MTRLEQVRRILSVHPWLTVGQIAGRLGVARSIVARTLSNYRGQFRNRYTVLWEWSCVR